MNRWRRRALWSAAWLLLLGLAWWWQQPSKPPEHATAQSQREAGSSGAMFAPIPGAEINTDTALIPQGSQPFVPGASSARVPPGVTAEQWAQLRAELSTQPNGEAELKRLMDYFVYADAVQRFRQLRAQGGALAEQQALAHELDRGLPDRLQRRELSAGDAQRIKLAVLEVLVPDASQRQHQLALWREAQAATLGPSDAEMAQREAQFQQQQAAIVAAWSARPPAERDPKVLEAQLEALRRASFATPSQ